MSTATLDPDTVAQNLFYKVVGSDGTVRYDCARTWGRNGNASVLATRERQWADHDIKEAGEAKLEKRPAPPTHIVVQITEQQYRAGRRLA